MGLTGPCSQVLAAALAETVDTLLATTPDPEQMQQVHLPTHFAGLQLQNPLSTCPLARAAHLLDT